MSNEKWDLHTYRKDRNAARAENMEKQKTYSKKSLLDNVQKKFTTTMIGALDIFEKLFGHLWGHGKPESALTQEEKEYRHDWEDARAAILNNGNNQARGAMDEISQHSVQKERYRLDFEVKGKGNE
jgi:hypothetical protein